MPKAPVDPVAALRAEEAAIAKRREDHEQPLFQRAEELLDQLRPLAAELAGLAPGFLTEYYGVLLAMPAAAVEKATMAVEQGRPKSVDFSAASGAAITGSSFSGTPKA